MPGTYISSLLCLMGNLKLPCISFTVFFRLAISVFFSLLLDNNSVEVVGSNNRKIFHFFLSNCLLNINVAIVYSLDGRSVILFFHDVAVLFGRNRRRTWRRRAARRSSPQLLLDVTVQDQGHFTCGVSRWC
ncbi:hypothetical protein QYE76_026660 [Lolium multiflorum]|uniref:Uncharacterized protein n=1 Tax=Lolium multiflorum TaxID=4521 RepID=A0AAD8RGE5_LOLMU|nr:hypothetical protein QYE76_026660 [Lolium multiflorum]